MTMVKRKNVSLISVYICCKEKKSGEMCEWMENREMREEKMSLCF